MKEYIERLVGCGYTEEKARALCLDYSRNLPLIELENLILSLEHSYVARVQS